MAATYNLIGFVFFYFFSFAFYFYFKGNVNLICKKTQSQSMGL